jgi:hypothetical protein
MFYDTIVTLYWDFSFSFVKNVWLYSWYCNPDDHCIFYDMDTVNKDVSLSGVPYGMDKTSKLLPCKYLKLFPKQL